MFKMATAIIATLLRVAWWVGQLLFALLRGVVLCLWVATRAVARCLWAFLRWLVANALPIILTIAGAMVTLCIILALVYGFNYVRQKAKAEAEAIKCETAFGEAMEVAGEAAEERAITARVRELVQKFGREVAKGELTVAGFSTEADGHLVELAAGDEGTQLRAAVLIDGTEAYLDWCAEPSEPDACPPSPYIYRGIGSWEHLLDKLETRKTAEQKAADDRFGTIFGETE